MNLSPCLPLGQVGEGSVSHVPRRVPQATVTKLPAKMMFLFLYLCLFDVVPPPGTDCLWSFQDRVWEKEEMRISLPLNGTLSFRKMSLMQFLPFLGLPIAQLPLGPHLSLGLQSGSQLGEPVSSHLPSFSTGRSQTKKPQETDFGWKPAGAEVRLIACVFKH